MSKTAEIVYGTYQYTLSGGIPLMYTQERLLRRIMRWWNSDSKLLVSHMHRRTGKSMLLAQLPEWLDHQLQIFYVGIGQRQCADMHVLVGHLCPSFAVDSNISYIMFQRGIGPNQIHFLPILALEHYLTQRGQTAQSFSDTINVPTLFVLEEHNFMSSYLLDFLRLTPNIRVLAVGTPPSNPAYIDVGTLAAPTLRENAKSIEDLLPYCMDDDIDVLYVLLLCLERVQISLPHHIIYNIVEHLTFK